MQAVLDHTIPYLHTREAFGQKIGHFQVSGILLLKCTFLTGSRLSLSNERTGHSISFATKTSLEAWNTGSFGMLPGLGPCQEVTLVSIHFLLEMNEPDLVGLVGEASRL